jgi:hypothetical protein
MREELLVCQFELLDYFHRKVKNEGKTTGFIIRQVDQVRNHARALKSDSVKCNLLIELNYEETH